ncbi:DNA alkylation repair protein [Fulvivirga lutea]|uniref:DNA alkylation repair protein n=1 Tax=Fulvivirga lutea TaxID=2810512 RepID=A0A975A2V2_9BACT|nr:DNA alkylation repair protein [Fulvivirga lutea]QSE99236.1 DNA alkylation repair protein [Fulvivirga lutea]
MIQSITRKNEITTIVDEALSTSKSNHELAHRLFSNLLNYKVKFPLLEHASTLIYNQLDSKQLIDFCFEIEKLKTIGGNVIIGKLLEHKLQDNFKESIDTATEIIALADDWYVTDIIGERVYGVALLNYPELMLTEFQPIAKHPVNWVVRSIGPGVHRAVKHGLSYANSEKAFQLLLSLAAAKDYHIKTGIGWAAKTIAKFHPDIIEKYDDEINSESVGQWFRGKVKIGLSRHDYAKKKKG